MTTNKTFVTRVVGVSFQGDYPANILTISDITNEIAEPLEVELEREPDNEHDANAIAVNIPILKIAEMSTQIGHVPREIAEAFAPVLDEDKCDVVAKVHEVFVDPNHLDHPGLEIVVMLVPK